jgi:thiol-disulfide isomerase/thioredoxin
MDRLPTLIAALLFSAAAACSRADPDPPPERVNAPRAPLAPEPVDLAALCDDDAAGDEQFSWPALAGAEPEQAQRWRWINVWATWCAPCVEEIPLLRAFERDLARDGSPIELVFLSVDESAEVVEEFRARHPDLPPGPRFADPADLPAFGLAIGLDEGAPIPLHVFVDPGGQIRCARAGPVRRDDYEAIAALLARQMPGSRPADRVR